MPKPSHHTLTWSEEQQCYELATRGHIQRSFQPDDESAWLAWVQQHRSFAFEGRHGHLSLIKEDRSRGSGYWYAYSRQARRTRKRYLGRTTTFVRLEEVASDLVGRPEIAPKQTADQNFPALLATKLSPPQPPAFMVERERLLKNLDAASSHRLVLLSAAAGSGKTTLLSMWASRRQTTTTQLIAWLSLEEHDNNPWRFWSYVVAALRVNEPAVGETALHMLQAPQPPQISTILTTLINDLVTSHREIVLILDDYHVINHPDTISSFQFLLDHLPIGLHLVLAGRSDPPLALPRLRARGQIIELRAQDLRFTRAETTQFFTRTMDLSLTNVEADILERRVEGWVAGLQLVALAMRSRIDYSAFIQQLRGNQRFILEYMQEEVLERQPQKRQDFLLHTSVLTRLHASLCQSVTEGNSLQDCQQMLLSLEKANLFLVPLDEERHWYRVHSLFRDVLQARLQAIHSDRVPIIHQRAARWYAQQGSTREAIIHALAGNDYVFAADLMEQSAHYMCLNGEAQQLYAWIKCLPMTILLAHTDMALTTALQLVLQTFYDPDEQWHQIVAETELIITRLELYTGALETTVLSEAEFGVLQKRLKLLRGWIASRTAMINENSEYLNLLITQMQEQAREDTAVWKAIPAYHLVAREPNTISLLPMLSTLLRQAEREQHPYEAIWMMERLGVVYRDMGELREAHQIMSEALQRLQQLGKARSVLGYLHLHLAELHWTRNNLAEAQYHLDMALRFARTWQHADIQITGCYQSIRIALALGRQEEADHALLEMEHLSQQSQWKHHQRLLIAARVLIWLARDQLIAASDWAVHHEVDPQPSRLLDDEEFAEAIALVRIFLTLEKHSDALQLLSRLQAHAEENGSTWHMVPVLALQVIALHASGEKVQASQGALRLLQLARPADYLRVYLDAGTSMQQIYQSLLVTEGKYPEWVHQSAIRTLLAAFKQQKRQQQAVHSREISAGPTSPASSSYRSLLTIREREVLHLLTQGKTNQEIADQMVVSLATAKKHVANILSKLEAENRVQAIAHARDHKLLP